MFRHLNSLRSRFLMAFLIFSAITLIVAATSFWFFSRSNRLNELSLRLERNLSNILLIIKYEQDFFSYETINPEFFKSGKSKYISQHHILFQRVRDDLFALINQNQMDLLKLDQMEVQGDVKNIIYELELYNKLFLELVALTESRGFKDFGLEGDMRDKIHSIENMDYGIEKADMLMLRRHEKDFIIRKDERYAQLLQEKGGLLLENLEKSGLESSKKNELIKLLRGYLNDFKELEKLEMEMGINSRSGKKGEMRQHADEVSDLMKILLSKIEKQVNQIKTQQYYGLSIVLIFCILLSLFLSYYLASIITRPIYRLKVAIQHIIARDFKGELEIIHNNAQDEVGELTRNFNAMLKELQSRLEEEKKEKRLK